MTFCIGLPPILDIDKFGKITTSFIQTLLKACALFRK